MDKIQTGNLNSQNSSNKSDWFIGHFIKGSTQFNNNEFEVKWAIHQKGERESQPTANRTAKTLSVLIQGKFSLKFQEEDKEIILDKLGDYVYHDANVYHFWETLEDSIILTIRWPSIPNDQVNYSKNNNPKNYHPFLNQ